MTDAIDIEAALATQKFLDGRTRFSDTKGTFARLAEYRDGAIFAGGFSGVSQWERHPNGDEVVQILKGSVTLSIVAADGSEEKLALKAGMLAVVPQGAWHQFDAPDGVTIMTTTPQPTEHISDSRPPAAK
jgi:mannose-6-phosphate isomerase-like protein (cupin superfamily)